MKTLEYIKLEIIDELTNGETQKYLGHASILNSAIDYLHSKGLLMVWNTDMDSAPRDTPILGGVPDKNIIDIIQLDTPVDWRYIDQPTAWMPLPAAPKGETK